MSPIFHRAILLCFSLFLLAGISRAQVPAPPSGSTTIQRIEEATAWETCGNCGNSGGSGAVSTYSMIRGITSPTVDGSATEFKIGGSYAYKNAYWYIAQYGSPTTPVSYLKYEFNLYVPSASANAPQAIEFECQQKAGGYVYNFAWQADYASHSWRVFDYVNRQWVNSGLSFSAFAPDKWHHLIAEFHASGTTAVHDALTIDGVRHVVNLRRAAKRGTSCHYLKNAFQLDLNGNPTAYKVYVDAMTITYK